MPVQCAQCDAELSPPYKFCGVCGAAQPELDTSPQPTSWHYAGPSGQDNLATADVVALVVAAPEADHHLWADGWDGWRSWQDVATIAEAVNAELAVRAEDPAAVADYERVLHEMLADGVLETWEKEVLDGLRAEKGISQATHDRLVEGYNPVRTALVAMAIDAQSSRGFRAGQFCVLRLKVRNESAVGLRRVRVYAASSTFEGVVTVDSPRIAPSADEAVLLRMQPQMAGQHELHAMVAATGYTGTPSWYRVRPTVFSVGAAPGGRSTQVYNMDLSSMQVGKVGQVGGNPGESNAGLATEASWVPLSLSPVTPQEAGSWLRSRGAELPEELRDEEAATADVLPPKPTAKPVADVLHYSGPSGQEELDHAAIAERITGDPDADHHLWQAGWDGWRDWRDVDPISALVDALLADTKVPKTLGDYVVLGPVDGHDELLRARVEGTMGPVEVWIRLLSKDAASEPGALAQLQARVDTARPLNHPGLSRVFSVVHQRSWMGVVQQSRPGGVPLAQWWGPKRTVHEVLQLTRALAEALHARGSVLGPHGRLHPGAITVLNGQPVCLDLALDDAELDAAVAWRAPEQANELAVLDHATDVFTLGRMCAHMLGQATVSSDAKALHQRLLAVVERATAARPADRFSNGAAFVAKLLAVTFQPDTKPAPKPPSDPRALQVALATLLARAAKGGLRLRPPKKLTAAWLAKATTMVDERLGAAATKPSAGKPSAGTRTKKKRTAWRDVGKAGGMGSYVTDMGRDMAALDKQLFMKTATAGERAIRRFIRMNLELNGHFALRNFGSLRVVLRPPWQGCNPATGRTQQFPAKSTVLFRPSYNTQASPLPKGLKRLKVRAEWRRLALSAKESDRLSFWAWTARAHLGTDPKDVVRKACDLSMRRRMAWFVHVDTGMKLSLACRVVRAWELAVRQNLYSAKRSFWGGGGNGRVCLYGVGTIRVDRRDTLYCHNPRTGRRMKVPPKDMVRFRISDDLSYLLNR